MQFTVRFAVVVMAVAVMISGIAQAQTAQKKGAPRLASTDCRTELKPTDTYRDLTSILKCLNDRIRALEASRAAGRGAHPPEVDRATVVQNGELQFEVDRCEWMTDVYRHLSCTSLVTNLTKEDKKLCIGGRSRLVTDRGVTFSSRGKGFRVRVGSNEGPIWDEGPKGPICDDLPPLSKSRVSIVFQVSERGTDREVQMLRVDCGSDCNFDAYKVPIR